MILVAVFAKTGFFDYVALKVCEKSKCDDFIIQRTI